MRKFTLAVLALAVPLSMFAARLTLKDGSVVYGKFIDGNTKNILFLDNNGASRRYDLEQIQSIDFNAAGQPAGQQGYSNRSSYDNDSYDNGSGYNSSGQDNSRRSNTGNYDNTRNSANRSADFAVLQPGTQLSVRTDRGINTQNATEGQTYPATITSDVADQSGNVVIPQGSEAELVVRQVNEGGTLSSGNLILDLQSVRVNGRRYMVSTEDVTQSGNQGIGKNKRTGEMVGGGAALGTLLGAVAGGGKGAAIGAIAGAAAGGGVQTLTKGKEIRVPAETVLTFRLDRPLRLREM